ncbi:MAG: alpha/beta fold hydrolase [Chloroflexi bacterium]|nr:alpha/beta fold hydrolase [Chloroflexota bacterium]
MTTFSITERYLDGQHGPMRYWESAPPRGTPLLLIHGYGALIEHWRAVIRPIATRHTLYALDLYFFGRSAIPAARPGRRLWAEQVAELIATVCPEPAVVVGHSLGGMVACQLAADFPQLVRGLVLVASTGLNDPQNQPSDFDNAVFSVIRSTGIGELLAGAVGNRWGARQGLLSAYYRKERVTPDLVDRFAEPLQRPGGARAYLAVTRSFPELFLHLAPGAISAPTLLIWGQHDRSVPPALADYFRRTLIPQAEIAIIPESGHCPFDETPDAFLATLLPWVARLPDVRPATPTP